MEGGIEGLFSLHFGLAFTSAVAWEFLFQLVEITQEEEEEEEEDEGGKEGGNSGWRFFSIGWSKEREREACRVQ